MPILSGADNIGMFTLSQALTATLWSVGLHGDNIVGAVTGTFLPAWDLQNVEFLVNGGAISAAPHVWTQGLSRLSMWTCSAWPLLILMLKDSKKLPQSKALWLHLRGHGRRGQRRLSSRAQGQLLLVQARLRKQWGGTGLTIPIHPTQRDEPLVSPPNTAPKERPGHV